MRILPTPGKGEDATPPAPAPEVLAPGDQERRAREPDGWVATLAFLELVQRLGGEVRVPATALAGWPQGQTLVIEDDPVTGERVFRLTRADLEARLERLLRVVS